MSSRRCGSRIAAALAVCVLAVLGGAPAAGATQTIVVGSMADSVDASPANGICEAPCSLRAAIQTANSAGSPGADAITLPAGTYNLAIAGADGPDPAATGDLDITDALTITGAGQATTTIDGKSIDRVFDTAGTTVAISGITVTGGLATDGAPTTAGGAIRVGVHPMAGTDVGGSLTLTDVTLRNNVAQDGAGVATDSTTANLTLTRVNVLDNTAPVVNTEGGGVNERFGGTVTIVGSTIRGNSAAFAGGVVDDGGGQITITDSTITENHGSTEAGGVGETGTGTITITRSTVSRNTSAFGAGVVEDGAGMVTIVDSTIRENAASGGPFPDAGGVLQDSAGKVSISGSTIVGNTARYGAGVHAISGGGTIAIANSTISGNHATGRGGGIQGSGSGTMTLTNVTLRDNIADVTAADLDSCVTLAGACGPTPMAITLRNTIVASGTTACIGPITSGGHNIDAGTSCGFAAAGDLVSTDPLLGALADNGGPTLTHLPLAGSPAVDRGDPSACPAADQRGVARPAGPVCDVGAVEAPVAVVVPPAPAPVVPAPVVPKPKPAPKASDIIVFPSSKACVSRRNFKIRLRNLAGVTIVSATVKVTGKRVQTVRGKRLTAPVDLRGLPRGRFTVTISLKTSAGKTLTAQRRYRTCAVKRKR